MLSPVGNTNKQINVAQNKKKQNCTSSILIYWLVHNLHSALDKLLQNQSDAWTCTHTQIHGERQREEKEMCCTWRSWSHNIVNMHAYMWKGDHPSSISWDTGHVLVCARVRERDNHDKASSLHVKLAGEGARSRAAWYNRGEACRYEWVSRGCVYQWGVGGYLSVEEGGGKEWGKVSQGGKW